MLALTVHSWLRRPVVTFLFAATVIWLSSGVASAQAATFAISSGQPPTATAGAAYSFQFKAAGGTPPYTWKLWVIGVEYLPAYPYLEATWGLQVDPATGVVSGTPMITGNLPIRVEVTDADYMKLSVQYDLVVGGTGSPQAITNSPPGGVQQTAYSNFRFQTTLAQSLGCDPSLYFIEGSLPPGLTLNLISGDLGNPPENWGTPLTAGTYTFTILGQRGDTLCGSPPYTNARTFTMHISPAASPSSPPGASDWVRPTSNAVLKPSPSGWDNFQIRSPAVIKVGGTYYMYYEGEDSAAHKSRIGLATSTDGMTWTKFSANPALSPGASGTWDSFEVRYPTVHFDGTTYRMWYWGGSGILEAAQIGLATSSDGKTWTKHAGPVFGTAYGGESFIPGTVLQVSGQFVMWYKTPYGDIGRATSANGVTWTDTGTAVLQGAGRPSVLQDGSTFRMWFMKADAPDGGGFAGSVGDVYTRAIGYASSPNGITWSKYTQSLSYCAFCIGADSVIPVFVSGPAGAWDRPGVGLPSVMKDGTTFKMWYTGGRINIPSFGSLNSSPFVEGAIGYAMSGGVPPPPAATLVSPSGTVSTATPTYTWNAVSGATRYYLKVVDSSGGTKVLQWYTATQAGCAAGTGTCSVTPATSLAAGAGQWVVQTSSAGGDGPWSSVLSFTVSLPSPRSLTVTRAGTGSGSVTSNPTGITCGATCQTTFMSNTSVALTAAPGAGATFKEWRGACSSSTPTCILSMSANRTVIAIFSKVFTDDPLAAQSTPLKALHFTELRDAINTLRVQHGRAAFAWTGTAPVPGGTVRVTHLTDLRTALTEAAGQPVPTYTDPSLVVGGTPIKASHLNELRSYVLALE